MRSTASKDCEGFTSAFSCAIPEVTLRNLWAHLKAFVDWKDRAMDTVSEDQLMLMFAELLGLAVTLYIHNMLHNIHKTRSLCKDKNQKILIE